MTFHHGNLSAEVFKPRQTAASSHWFAFASIALVAAALTLPGALGPTRTNDSFWIDWVWLDQFAHQLGSGTIYPRWLPLSHHGLGSPVFYYYPPLAFYAGSLFVLAGLSTYAAIFATFFAAYLLSGVGMYAWLKPQSRVPLVGALIYLVAPYHTFNCYNRGAMAEAFATAILPLVMLATRKLARDGRGGFVMLAVAYAALIASHLPLAMLASIFLIGPYALIQTRRAPARAVTIGAGLALGIALAAIYLVPAFLLEPYRDTAKLWEMATLQPANWSFWNLASRASHNYRVILVVAAAVAVPLAWLAARYRSGWAMFGMACVVIAIGLFPFFWSLPLLRSAQFPFRLLPVAEFALATSIALVALRAWERIASLLALLGVTVLIAGSHSPPNVSLAELAALHPDVPENLPPGPRPYGWPSVWALDIAADHRAALSAHGVTVEPAFYYPAWQVRCGNRIAPTFADPATKLLSYRGPADCALTLRRTPAERTGLIVSLVALLSLICAGLAAPLRRRRSHHARLSDQG